jgi:hypothetical protein
MTLHGPDCGASKALLLALGQCGEVLHLVREAVVTIVEIVSTIFALVFASKSVGRLSVTSARDDGQGGASMWC